jgi:hypothetical protein
MIPNILELQALFQVINEILKFVEAIQSSGSQPMKALPAASDQPGSMLSSMFLVCLMAATLLFAMLIKKVVDYNEPKAVVVDPLSTMEQGFNLFKSKKKLTAAEQALDNKMANDSPRPH